MRYGVKDLIIAMLLGFVLGAFTLAAGIADAAERDLTGRAATPAQFDRHDMQTLRTVLARGCALRMYEDGSAVWERNDDARHMCLEVVSQIGR